jgi:hypothetical protein
MTDPTPLCLESRHFAQYISHFKSEKYIFEVLNSDWFSGQYEENVDKSGYFEKSHFFYPPGFDKGQTRKEYYRTNQSEFIQSIISEIRQANDLPRDVKITANDHIFPPGTSLLPHIDKGEATGCSLILPALGSVSFCYDEIPWEQNINEAYYFNNKQRHLARNNQQNRLGIIMVLHIGVSIEHIRDIADTIKTAD